METQVREDIKETDYPNRRRPWIAVFLSLLMPGMGQIYCGSITSGLVLMLTVIMFSTMWMFIMIIDRVREGTPVAVSFVAWGFVLQATVVAAIDAYRRARRTRYDYQLKDYNNWAVYLALLWICGAGTFGFTAIVKMNLFEAFYIPVNSMAPTMMAGDRAIANKMSYSYNNPEYGDVVLFKNPENRKENYIERVVALGGDTVETKNGQLFINGQQLERQQVQGDIFWEINNGAKYQILISKKTSGTENLDDNFGPITVPDYHCFLMGDNRNHSKDSRTFGSLSVGALKGQFMQIYWPLQHRATLDPTE